MKTTSFKLKNRNVYCFNVKDQEDTTSEVLQLDRVHNLLIIDRSGSMSGDIDQLIDNVIIAVEQMREEDLISIIWFSGAGQKEFVVRAKCLYQRDKQDIKLLLERLRSTVGCTCFSESFALVNQLIEDESVVCKNYNILFFTDGCPVTPWSTTEEVSRVMSEVDKMKDKVLAINSIGYGFYYDIDLLKAISEKTTFGKYFHNRNVSEYLEVFTNTYEIAKNASLEKIKVVSEDPYSEILYLSENFTKLFSNSCEINANKRKNQFFVISESKPTVFVNDEKIEISESTTREATVLNFAYSYASELFYKGSTLEAIDVIYELTRDKSYIDKMNTAFTFSEKNEIVENLKKAVFNRKFKNFRLVSGKCFDNYLPADDAFCFFDLISLLKEQEAYYIPLSSSEYKRIGVKTVDTFNTFKSDGKLVYTSFEKCVYNQEQANLSLQLIINGEVTINPKEAKRVGLETNKYPAYKYRNQTLIKDGNRNVDYIKAFVKPETVSLIPLPFENMETPVGSPDGYVCIKIDVQDLPIVNKLYHKESNDLKSILQKINRGIEIGFEQKIIRYFINKITDERPAVQKVGIFENLTNEQIAVLQDHGLNKDGIHNEISREKIQSEDFYESRKLIFSVEGWSTIPKVDETVEKRDSIKNGSAKANAKLTDSESLLLKYYDYYDNNGYSRPIKSNVEVLETKLKELKVEDRKNEDSLAVLRIAKICTNSWWNNLIIESKRNKDYFTFTDNNSKLMIRAEKAKIFY